MAEATLCLGHLSQTSAGFNRDQHSQLLTTDYLLNILADWSMVEMQKQILISSFKGSEGRAKWRCQNEHSETGKTQRKQKSP